MILLTLPGHWKFSEGVIPSAFLAGVRASHLKN